MLDTRGTIVHRERARQLRDFSGLRFGSITPTDIDGLIEYKNKYYVIMEGKYGDAQHKRGQTLALERLCDDLQKVKPTLLIFARHYTEVDKDVDYSACKVEKYRFKGVWRTAKTTVRELIEMFIGGMDKCAEQISPRPKVGF